jgi:hypothetical protein
MILAGALLASPASAAWDGSADVGRDLAVRVGPIVGGALTCRDIVRPRLQLIVDQFHTVIRDAAGNEAERADIAQLFDCSITDGARALKRTGPRTDAERVVERLEAMNNFDLGMGATLNFGRGEHQASHQIWGTALDAAGIFQPIDLE